MLAIYQVMSNLILSQAVSEYVRQLYNDLQTPELQYHNLVHTERVVQRTYEIAANYKLDEEELFILSAAAWFHDTGHLFGRAKEHETRSVSIMKEFLITHQVPEKTIASIKGCILATKLPQDPKTLLEQIICDADTFHLGTTEFLNTDKALKKEFELRNNTNYKNWDQLTLNVLEEHKFHTPFCQRLLNDRKKKNIEIVRSKL
jgi:predicted metal-dependent HD superfamily phosphohydrolase